MKKITILLFALLLTLTALPLTAYAQDEPRPLTEVLAENSADERAIFDDTERYGDGMTYEWIDDEPLVTVYEHYGYFWYLQGETFEEMDAELKALQADHANSDLWSESYVNCLALGDVARMIRKTTYQENGKTTITSPYAYGEEKNPEDNVYPMIPPVRDLMEGSSRQSFCGEEHNVLDAVGFISSYPFDDDVVCYITDGGVFYRCYNQRDPERVLELSESEMALRKKQYQDYKCHYTPNENGNLRIGEGSFYDFMKQELWELPLTSYAEIGIGFLEKSILNEPTDPEVKIGLNLWIAIPCVLAGAITAFLIARKKKKQKFTEE